MLAGQGSIYTIPSIRHDIPTVSRDNGIAIISENVEYPSVTPQLSINTNCTEIEMPEEGPLSYDEATKAGIS